MVITILEARVPEGRLPDVENEFRAGMSPLPPEIVESYLARDSKDASLYRLVTVWRSLEDLQAMRASGETPKGVRMFAAVGATTSLTVHDVVVHSHR